jgi:hypothetical protein
MFKLLIYVVYDRRMEIGGNSHAEICPPWWLKYYENLINWLDVNTLKIEEIILY